MVPSERDLRAALSETLGDPALEVVSRRSNVYVSTFPTEIVACRRGDGSSLMLFCKYSAGRNHNDDGHRGGIEHEVRVHQEVLAPLALSKPRYYGARAHRSDTWLFVEYLAGGVRVNTMPALMSQASRWAGKFHALGAERLARGELTFLRRYDASYYRRWFERVRLFADADESPWIEPLGSRFQPLVELLAEQHVTVIHGEFTPHNVLVRDQAIFPVDWESVAVGAGEVDLAALTDAWPAEIVTECEAAYVAARWGDEPPADFALRLGAARLYWSFRWLGLRRQAITSDRHGWRVKQVTETAEALGLI